MNHGSLFSGIGGFDLAAEWAGWENIFHCEWNPFGQKVLNHYWPNAESFTDITKTDFKKYANTIDILTGGFPCQPYSVAGKRKGKEDDRHLWPEMLRAIREIKPRYIVGENVSGLVSWDRGLVFEEVQTDLEAEGYKVQAVLLPACAVDAPHRRDRVWFVAYSASNGYDAESKKGCNTSGSDNKQSGKGWISTIEGLGNERSTTYSKGAYDRGERDGLRSSYDKEEAGRKTNSISKSSHFSNEEYATDTTIIGLRGQGDRIGKSRLIDQASQTNDWKDFPTQSPVCNGDDGLSSRLDGITFPKWRNESIKAGGNAIVPQVAFEIFKVINQLEQ